MAANILRFRKKEGGEKKALTKSRAVTYIELFWRSDAAWWIQASRKAEEHQLPYVNFTSQVPNFKGAETCTACSLVTC